MKQVQIEESRFPKLASVNDNPSPEKNQKRKRSSAHSQMIRIIIALLIAIFIYNESQQTTINYNQIIKNQKMFIVKNIRGVIPTLSGNVKDLEEKWKVVHFQNYRYNESEMFANFTLKFNKTHLVVENIPCNIKIVYDWKNYSYNIDLAYLSQSQAHTVKVTAQQPVNNTQKVTENETFKNQHSSQTKVDRNSQSLAENSTPQSTQQIFIQPLQNIQSVVQNVPKSPQSLISNQTKAQCQRTVNSFKQVILSTSVWTISGVNLYLLLENELYKQDFYLILQPYTD